MCLICEQTNGSVNVCMFSMHPEVRKRGRGCARPLSAKTSKKKVPRQLCVYACKVSMNERNTRTVQCVHAYYVQVFISYRTRMCEYTTCAYDAKKWPNNIHIKAMQA